MVPLFWGVPLVLYWCSIAIPGYSEVFCCLATVSGFSTVPPAFRILLLWFAVLPVLHLCLLRYSPQRKFCRLCRLQLYVTPIFLSPLFLHFFFLEFINLFLTVLFVLSCALFCFLSCPSFDSFRLFFLLPVLFSPSVYSLCFLIFFIIFFSNLLSFLFFSFFLPLCSVCFSLIFYYYSICSLSVRALYLILLCYLFCSCF